MFWIMVCAGGAVALVMLAGGGDGLDYRAREIRASIARRDAQDGAQMRRLRWARRRQSVLHMQ